MSRIQIFTLVMGWIFSLSYAFAEVSTTEATPNEVVCQVQQAATQLSQQGEAGLAEFKKPDGKWVWKDSFMFVIDCDANKIVAHPFPELLKDNQQLTKFMEKRKKLCETGHLPNGGWLSYLWTEPTAQQVLRKTTYVKSVKNTNYQIAAGIPDREIPLEELNKLRCYAGKKILHIDSYDDSYNWSLGILRGINKILLDTQVELKTVYMDTKRNTSDEFAQQAAQRVKSEIEVFQPDVVIASDDNASKYIVMPYYKDASLPFVFCGINWDITPYGYPYQNTTGMVEVELIDSIVKNLRLYAKGDRLGYLAPDELSEHKIIQNHTNISKIHYTAQFFVKSFTEWKQRFLELQSSVDMILLTNNGGISGWDNAEAQHFVEQNTKIPVGAQHDFMMPYALLGIVKSPEEQGEWAAQAALKILDGTKPSEIPIARNKQGKLYINLRMGNRLNILFTPELLELAEIIR
ncbi:MAG: ABC transporter substrate binding protein [Thiotrichaceae bacterium]